MRDFFIILTIISAASAFPLPSAQDADLFSDSGSDPYSLTLDGLNQPSLSDQPLLLAGSDIGDTNEVPAPSGSSPPQAPPIANPPFQLPAGFDPSVFDDIPWSIPSGSSWTDLNRPTSQGDGSYITPEEKFRKEQTGEDYETNYGYNINPDVNGPTSFELSPEQTSALIKAGTLVVGGVTWVYNGATGVINWVGNTLGGWVPSSNGL